MTVGMSNFPGTRITEGNPANYSASTIRHHQKRTRQNRISLIEPAGAAGLAVRVRILPPRQESKNPKVETFGFFIFKMEPSLLE